VKIFLILFLSISVSTSIFAQEKSSNSKPKNDIPKFKIMNIVDSSKFTDENLQKDKKTILIYFGADCGHCNYFTKKMMDSLSLFQNTQIVMVSSSEYTHIQKFAEDNKLASCPFITVGRDGDYFFVSHYEIRMFPTAIVYNKKGKYVKRFESEMSISELVSE
jgi:thioredoxin-related protein